MTLALLLLGLSACLELMVAQTHLWHHKRVWAVLCSLLAIGAACSLLVASFTLTSCLVAVMAVYRVINLGRLIQEQMNEAYLSQKFQTSSLWLSVLQFALVGLCKVTLSKHFWLQLSAVGLVLVNGGLAYLTWRHIKRARPTKVSLMMADRDLPTLTVAIPARNETEDLQLCLESLVKSNYPKLEILVLDDCSQNKRTPEIIRQFAHDGVRFIGGQVPPENWLAKNYAYQQLAQEANGQLVLFCGVDTRFEPYSLRQLVEFLLQEGYSMISVMPRNRLLKTWNPEKIMVQPNRYIWELALPRTFFKRPSVLSTCWMIKADLLRAAGGMEAVRNSISPESYFARRALNTKAGYRFIYSDDSIGLSCDKRLSDQRDTAVRVRYPQLHRRPELAGLLSLAEVWLLLVPIVGLVISLARGLRYDSLLYGLSCALMIACYSTVVSLTYRRFVWRSLWLLPLAAVYDVLILNYSMWQYEFNQVIWKGRNVCIPMMHVVSHLPRL